MRTRKSAVLLTRARVVLSWMSLLLLMSVAACGGGGSAESPGGSVTPAPPVAPAKPAAPVISAQPASQTVQVGQTVTFSVTATGDAPLTYQWLKNGADVAGANQSTYSLLATSADHGSILTAKVSNAGGALTSASALLSVVQATNTGQLSLIAGVLGGPGNLDGFRTNARFDNPLLLTSDRLGNLYVLEAGAGIPRSRLRKLSPEGTVTSVIDLTVSPISGLAVDSKGNIYCAHWLGGDLSIKRVSADGVITTIAIEISRNFDLDTLNRIAGRISLFADTNDHIFVADAGNGRIQKISSQGEVREVATVTGLLAGPHAMAMDLDGNIFGVRSDGSTKDIVKIDSNGAMSIVAVTSGRSIWADQAGNLYFQSASEQVMVKMSPGGAITRAMGMPVPNAPAALDKQGNLYFLVAIGDFGSPYAKMLNGVRKFSTGMGIVDWVGLDSPYRAIGDYTVNRGLTRDTSGNLYVMTDTPSGPRRITKLSSTGEVGFSLPVEPRAWNMAAANGQVYFTTNHAYAENTSSCLVFANESKRAAQGKNMALFFPAECNGFTQVHRIDANGNISVFAGAVGSLVNPATNFDGPGSQVTIKTARALTADANGNLYLLTSDRAIRKISSDGSVGTVGYTSAQYGSRMATGNQGSIYIARGGAIWKLSSFGGETLIAGNEDQFGDTDGVSTNARFSTSVDGLVVDVFGNVFVADSGNNLIRKITADGAVTTVAGQRGKFGNTLGALPGTLDNPGGLSVDSDGNLYFYSGSAILKLKL